MYGSIDVANVSKTHTAGNGTQMSKTTGTADGFNAGNRIGFRGTEDLGGGLKASFVIEQGINITNGQLFSTRAAAAGQAIDGVAASGNMPTGAYSTATNRQSFVGASGGFGEIRAGYMYTALYTVSTNNGYHVGSEQPGGDLAHGTLSNANFGGTRANGIMYIAPTMSGVTVSIQKGAAGGREDVEIASSAPNTRAVDKTNRWSILADYANGPLKASYAHTSLKQEQSAATIGAFPTTIFGSLSATAISSTGGADKANNYTNTLDQLGGSYVLGSLKLVASMANGSIEDSVTPATNNATTKAKQIGAEYTIGAARPFVTTGTGTVTTDATGVKSFDGKLSQVGVRYDLSKRTIAYFMTGSTKDSAAASDKLAKRKATAIGLYHSF